MRTLLALLLILALVPCCAALADDPAEIPGTVEMPYAGLRFIPPEEYRDTKGIVTTDGAVALTPDVQYAYWLYCAMREDELAALYSSGEGGEKVTVLFYVFSIGSGMDFKTFMTFVQNPLPEEYAREIGRIGEYTFYLYMEGPDEAFAAATGPEYAEEYTRLAGLADGVAAAFTCYEPLNQYSGQKGAGVSFTTKDLDGNTVSSDELFGRNEVTLVNIWATWCGPCVGELAELQQIHLRLQEKGCGVVGLLVDDDLDSARALVKQNGITYPVILAPRNYYNFFPTEAYPTTYFVSRDGNILTSPVVGAYVNEYEGKVEALIK